MSKSSGLNRSIRVAPLLPLNNVCGVATMVRL
jgi:hypothetical protein